MDKEVLAIIGKLYLDLYSLNEYAESLKKRVGELEALIPPINNAGPKLFDS